MSEKKLLSIGRVSRITGTHIKSLRYYDRIGVLKPAYTNPETGYRFYTVPQLYTLEAIQMCIELNIPLKEFSRFVDGGQRLHYDALLAYGRETMRKHMETIQRSMDILETSQQEMEVSEQYRNRKGAFARPFESMSVALVPIREKKEEAQMVLEISGQYPALEASGMVMGYAYGYLYDFHPEGVERYSFIQILSEPIREGPIIRMLPAGDRQCLWSRGESCIEQAETLFPEAFRRGGTVTAIEQEILCREHDIHHPLMELYIL